MVDDLYFRKHVGEKRPSTDKISPNKKQKLNSNVLERNCMDITDHKTNESPAKHLSSNEKNSAMKSFVSKLLATNTAGASSNPSSQPSTPGDSICDIFSSHNNKPSTSKLSLKQMSSPSDVTPRKESITHDSDVRSPSTSELPPLFSRSLSQRSNSPTASPKKYTKLLKLTPTNTPTKDSESQSQSQHSSTVHVTPVKSEHSLSQTSRPSPFKSPFKSPLGFSQSQSSTTSSKSSAPSRRKSKKPPVMPQGALLKFFTPKGKQKAEPVTPTKPQVQSLPSVKNETVTTPTTTPQKEEPEPKTDYSLLGNDIEPLDDSSCTAMDTDILKTTDNIKTAAADTTSRQSESSCLGILDGLSRLSLDERGQLYTYKFLLDECTQVC